MTIKMFDCGFGDSFLLHYNEECNPLLVDFGIHQRSKKRGKVPAYENVVKTVNAIDKKDFMLTHFHGDHFSGMLYWKKHWRTAYPNRNFDKIIVPGVNSLAVIKVLLFLSLRCSHDKVYFIEFLEWYCRSRFRGLRLVSRGDRYHNLEILWPDKKSIEENAKKNLAVLNEDDEFATKLSPLLNFAEEILILINTLTEDTFNDYEEAIKLLVEVKKAKKTIEDSLSDEEKKKYIEKIKELNIGNECSIVFQYKESIDNDKERNCLFTGDVISDAWSTIEGCVPPLLYDKFDVIKLPHHGTKCYYHDFVARVRDGCRFLIPNGSIRDTGWYTYINYRIDTVPVIAAYDNVTVNAWSRTGFDTIINRDDSEDV